MIGLLYGEMRTVARGKTKEVGRARFWRALKLDEG